MGRRSKMGIGVNVDINGEYRKEDIQAQEEHININVDNENCHVEVDRKVLSDKLEINCPEPNEVPINSNEHKQHIVHENFTFDNCDRQTKELSWGNISWKSENIDCHDEINSSPPVDAIDILNEIRQRDEFKTEIYEHEPLSDMSDLGDAGDAGDGGDGGGDGGD